MQSILHLPPFLRTCFPRPVILCISSLNIRTVLCQYITTLPCTTCRLTTPYLQQQRLKGRGQILDRVQDMVKSWKRGYREVGQEYCTYMFQLRHILNLNLSLLHVLCRRHSRPPTCLNRSGSRMRAFLFPLQPTPSPNFTPDGRINPDTKSSTDL
jgi:hypothetical protein